MRVLITGGAGFIGTRITELLQAAGHEVRIVDALLPDVHTEPPEIAAGVDVLWGDLRNPEVTDRALDGIDVVCHQAAMVGRGKEISDAPKYVGCNDLATAVLLATMARRGMRQLVLGSSVVIYGESRYRCPEHGEVAPGPRQVADLDAGRFEPPCPHCAAPLEALVVDEDSRLDPRNVYALTKLAQEHLVASWARETGASTVALRYHNVYGPGMPYESPYSGVASTFRSAVARGEAPQVFEDGGPRRDFIHVRDVAAANLAAVTAVGTGATTHGPGMRAYNVASGEPRPILDMAAALSAAVGGPEPVITGRYRLGDVRHIFASPARLMDELNWRPQVTFDAGMKEFARATMRGLPRG
nr:NAD-dependent dehydratase [uncultured bacterium]